MPAKNCLATVNLLLSICRIYVHCVCSIPRLSRFEMFHYWCRGNKWRRERGERELIFIESLEHYARHKTYTTHLVLVQSYENLIITSIFHKVGSFRNKLPKVIPTSPCRTSSGSQYSWPILIIQCYLLRRKETANHAFESVFSLLSKHSKKLKGRKIHVFNKILVDLNNEHSTCCSMTINK